ncbi:MAG: hypothetical protein WDA02_06405 [Saccharofermentanales bacterium]
MVDKYLIKVIRHFNSIEKELNNIIQSIKSKKLNDYELLKLRNPTEILMDIEETSHELRRIEPNKKIRKLTELFIYFLDNEDYINYQKIKNIIKCKKSQQSMKEDLF